MDGFVDRLHALRFLRACDPSYRALTFTLVGLPLTGYISLLLDILFGSFLPGLWSSSNQSLLGSRSRQCYALTSNLHGRFPRLPGSCHNSRLPTFFQLATNSVDQRESISAL